jgi:hypothetical protein
MRRTLEAAAPLSETQQLPPQHGAKTGSFHEADNKNNCEKGNKPSFYVLTRLNEFFMIWRLFFHKDHARFHLHDAVSTFHIFSS